MNTLKNALKAQYSQIPNDLIIDMDLSSNALRVLLYLFTKPDNWNVYNADICKQLNISEKSLTKYWKELLNSKWLRRTKKQSSSGKFTGGYIYHIGNFTISEESSVSVKSGGYNNNIPLQQEETNSNNKIKKIEKKDLSELKNTKKDFDIFIDLVRDKALIKTKVTKGRGDQGFKSYSEIENKEQLLNDYISHQNAKKEFAKTLANFMIDYDFEVQQREDNDLSRYFPKEDNPISIEILPDEDGNYE